MACEYCMGIGYHDKLCPNYILKKPKLYCSICGNGIYDGEEYIVKNNDEFAHYDCLTDLSYRAMIEWFGGEIRTMEDDYD